VRLIFAGTPEFARVALERLHASGHTIALVLTQPDRPAGRGMKLQPSAVKAYAVAHQIPVAQPRSLKLDGKFPEDAELARQAIADADADAMVVAAYGLILPQWVLDDMSAATMSSDVAARGIAKLGCLNIHGSLLPRWRGAAPIHRAIEAGDTETGITIMQMDAGLDTGDMLLVRSVPIGPQATTGQLHDQLADLGADMVVQALDRAAAGRLSPQPQPDIGVTYAPKIDKSEAALDWHQPAEVLVRRVRAFVPFPVATTQLHGETLKVWAAQMPAENNAFHGHANGASEAGTVLAVDAAGIAVAAIDSVAVLTELQRPGGKRMPLSEFLKGFEIRPGMRMELVSATPGPLAA
jgi:methionyl-tRNA formyltransferase